MKYQKHLQMDKDISFASVSRNKFVVFSLNKKNPIFISQKSSQTEKINVEMFYCFQTYSI